MNPSYNNGGIYSSGSTPPVPSAPISTPPVMQVGDSSRKPKKGIVIGGILIVLALVLGILTVVLIPKSGGGNSGNVGENADFYKYANYILNGSMSADKNIGEYEESRDYAATEAFDNDNVDYFATAQEVWSAFYQRIINNEEITETSDLRGYANWQNELMDFMNKYMNTKKIEDEDIVKLYLDNGYEKAMDLINERYASLSTVFYAVGLDYAKSLVDWSKAIIDLYANYDSNGCLVDGDVDDACVENNIEKTQDAYDRYVTAMDNLYINDIDIYEVLQMLELNCFNIREHLENSEVEK